MVSDITILCVEDEELLLGDLFEELEEAGYTVVAARNGHGALRALKTVTPDLILCDVMMPEMDGAELLKTVREAYPALDKVPFMFLTARCSREDVIEGKKLGVDDYLTKPVDYDLLLATIEARLAGVKRMTEHSRQQLATLRRAYQEAQKEEPPMRVAVVASNTGIVAPISSALTEVGCLVKPISDEALRANTFAQQRFDIAFMVYSKKVHYLLQYLARTDKDGSAPRIVMLIPSKFGKDARQALEDLGVETCIEYPFRPVEIFKVIIDTLSRRQRAGRNRSAETAGERPEEKGKRADEGGEACQPRAVCKPRTAACKPAGGAGRAIASKAAPSVA
ncbi:response regulator [Breoghania sp.]|uniref:response regulator transcription factor n=1 Tax=Breoghania sp. TaxID=2065378 RepID=UPI002AA8CF81|nr:response regulator [Breoghania sp.]